MIHGVAIPGDGYDHLIWQMEIQNTKYDGEEIQTENLTSGNVPGIPLLDVLQETSRLLKINVNIDDDDNGADGDGDGDGYEESEAEEEEEDE